MSEPIETKPAEAKPAETKAAPCGAKKSALCGAAIGVVFGTGIGWATHSLAVWLPLGIVLGLVFSGMLRGGGG